MHGGDFLILQNIKAGYGAHPVSLQCALREFYPGGKAAGMWRPLIFK
jgi:hypothetical protein